MKKIALLLTIFFCVGSMAIAAPAEKTAPVPAKVKSVTMKKVAVKKVVKVKKARKTVAKKKVTLPSTPPAAK